MLKIKTLKEILGGMVTHITLNTSKITDFSKGSAIRTILEALGLQMEEFYFSMHDNIIWAIENSLYKAFGFDLKPASKASGEILVTFKEPLKSPMTIYAGSEFSTSPGFSKQTFFKSLADTIVQEGAVECLVRVECTEAGLVGNISVGKVDVKTIYDPRILYVMNPEAMSGGSDVETREARKKRFLNFVATLSKATEGAIMYACANVNGVQGVSIDDSKAGIVRVYAHDSNGELSKTLKTFIELEVENYRSAGVEVIILPVTKVEVEVHATVTLKAGYSVETYQNLIRAKLENYLNAFSVSDSMYVSALNQVIMNSYDDVIEDCKISRPAVDITAAKDSLVRAGKISIICVNLGV